MSAIDTVRELATLIQKLDNVPITDKVIQLQSDVMQLQEDLFQLREENRQLKESLTLKEDLIFEEDLYWKDVEPREGPFCTNCLDGEDRLVRMHQPTSKGFTCPKCDTFVPNADFKRRREHREDNPVMPRAFPRRRSQRDFDGL